MLGEPMTCLLVRRHKKREEYMLTSMVQGQCVCVGPSEGWVKTVRSSEADEVKLTAPSASAECTAECT